MSAEKSEPTSQGWVSHALALCVQGQCIADIAFQVDKSEDVVARTINSQAFQRQLQLKLTSQHGSLRAVIDSLLKDSAVRIVQNLITLAQGSGQHAIRAATLILPRILGDNTSGLNLDTSSAQGIGETVERLRLFLTQNPAIKAELLGGQSPPSPQHVQNDENDSPPAEQPANVVPIVRAVQPPRGGEASSEVKQA